MKGKVPETLKLIPITFKFSYYSLLSAYLICISKCFNNCEYVVIIYVSLVYFVMKNIIIISELSIRKLTFSMSGTA